jgi:hypothetical protein
VLLSPCRSLFDFDLWYHLISSSLSNWISPTFKQCFISNSCGKSIVISAFLSNCSSLPIISFFSFLYDLFIFFTHPLRYRCRALILFCHFSNEVEPLFFHCHTSATFSWKPSLNNHANSNLNVHLFDYDGTSVSSNMGVSSEIPLGKLCTVTLENFSSHFVLTKILSSFSYVDICKLLAHVN